MAKKQTTPNLNISQEKPATGYLVAFSVLLAITFLLSLSAIYYYTFDTSVLDTSTNEMAPLGIALFFLLCNFSSNIFLLISVIVGIIFWRKTTQRSHHIFILIAFSVVIIAKLILLFL